MIFQEFVIELLRNIGVTMANSTQIKALIKAYLSDNNVDRFRTLSLQIAAHEAQKGHLSLANEIKKIVDDSKNVTNKVIPFTPDLSDLVLLTTPKGKKCELVISKDLKDKIDRILKEYYNKNKLSKYGLHNRRKLLLVGAPGTGKTMTASVIASELNLPLYTIQMDRLVNKYMGETSQKLRQIFDIIQKQKGIFLFDEFDAIGTERASENDVGEMRRVLNSFLQFIENNSSESLILAATNNISLLDQALFRRFDDILDYQKPTNEQIKLLLENRLSNFRGKFDINSIITTAYGLSHSEITQACMDAIKEVILDDKKKVTKTILKRLLEDRKKAYRN